MRFAVKMTTDEMTERQMERVQKVTNCQTHNKKKKLLYYLFLKPLCV